jgi:putative (di)nucleoside polyphosphate hydrolase
MTGSDKKKTSLPYRPCAGMMVINKDGLVFIARRVDQSTESWQMPQGGIDANEDAREAAYRELEEEIGTRNVRLLAEIPEWLHYDLPEDLIGTALKGKYRGQKQKWFLFQLLGEDAEINIETKHPEFSEWKWIESEQLPDVIVPFKRDIYETVLAKFRKYLTNY